MPSRMTVIALLRGINVGGHRKVPMASLRAICESLGFTDVRTYLQSGNVVFGVPKSDPGLAARLESALESALGFRPAVILRSAAEWQQIVDGNPFSSRADLNPAKLAVVFLADRPSKAISLSADPEEVIVAERELYVYYPEGMGRSKLTLDRIEKAAGVPGTARNWNTVMALLEAAKAI